MINILVVAVGGAVGSVARYVCSLLLVRADQAMPIAIPFVNILGAFILGIVFSALDKEHPAYLLLAVGFCGGFTTFSTFSMESWQLISAGRLGSAAIYILGSVIFSILAFGFGLYLTRA